MRAYIFLYILLKKVFVFSHCILQFT